MSRLPPVPPAARPVHGPEGVPKTSIDVTHRVRQGSERLERGTPDPEMPDSEMPGFEPRAASAGPAAAWLPALLLAGLAGYALGRLTLGR